MSTLPPNLSGGSPAPTHADFNALRKFAMENSLTSGAPGLRRRAFGGGSLVTPIQGRKMRGVLTPKTLFVYDNSTPSDVKISVTFGQINGETPTIGGTAISATTPPSLAVVSGAVYLHVTVDTSGVITALTIENSATMPDDTNTEGYLTLALVTVTGSSITSIQHAAWNLLQMQVCGSVAGEGEISTFLWGGFGE